MTVDSLLHWRHCLGLSRRDRSFEQHLLLLLLQELLEMAAVIDSAWRLFVDEGALVTVTGLLLML